MTQATRRHILLKLGTAALLTAGFGHQLYASGLPPLQVPPANGFSPVHKPVPQDILDAVNKRAAWLPPPVRNMGIDEASASRFKAFPLETQYVLSQLGIPHWYIGLMPYTSNDKNEIIPEQLVFMSDLAGDPAQGKVAQRSECLALAAAAGQLPTYDGLGIQGCVRSVTGYFFSQLRAEFPDDLDWMSDELIRTSSSIVMMKEFAAAAAAGNVRMRVVKYNELTADDIEPGAVVMAGKPLERPDQLNNHLMVGTRVPKKYNSPGHYWSPYCKMFIGNTGLLKPPHIKLCQEIISSDPKDALHNMHEFINSDKVWPLSGKADPHDPRTNVYSLRKSDFIIIYFLDKSQRAKVNVANLKSPHP